METRKSFARGFLCLLSAAIIAAIAGCGTAPPSSVRMKSETELAVSAIKTEWLTRCEIVVGPMPENQVGALLQDYADVVAPAAECVARYNSLIDYLKPVVEKERGK